MLQLELELPFYLSMWQDKFTVENDRRLLLISCSQRKRTNFDVLPAIERYNGPAFAILRRYLKTQSHSDLDIYILSASYGLIPHSQQIPEYNQKMTLAQSEILRPKVLEELSHIVNRCSYSECCLSMGKIYLNSLCGIEAILSKQAEIFTIEGGTGKRLSQLRQWLYKEKLSLSPKTTKVLGRACIGSIEIAMTQAQVFEKARYALKDHPGKALCYTTWYVLVDGQRVAPKWLVSQLTGLPVSNFHTDAARRVLEQLGIPIYNRPYRE